MVDYRLDHRTFEEFADHLQKHTEKEFQYMLDWLQSHNRRRHKRDYVVIPWGCDNEVYEKSQYAKHLYRPDFLLIKCFDNSYLVNQVYPIEVTTMSNLSDRIYFKKSKVKWDYDKLTPQVANHKHFILFIINTEHPGKEEYHLFGPRILKRISQQRTVRPGCFGKKECFTFLRKNFTWKPLYLHGNQNELFNLEDMQYVATFTNN